VDYHSKQYFDRRGRELPNERERFLDLFDQLGKSISSWLLIASYIPMFLTDFALHHYNTVRHKSG